MYTVNVPELRGKMAVRGITMSKLAEIVGVNRNTLANYFNNPEKLTYQVVNKLILILQLTQDDANSIFFANKLTHEKDDAKIAG